MDTITYFENLDKVKSNAIKKAIILAALLVFGVILVQIFPSTGARYLDAAFKGALVGAIGVGVFFGIKELPRAFAKLKKPPVAIILADEKGVTVDMLAQGESVLIPWQNIQSIKPVSMFNIQNGVGFMLQDPDEYINSLSKPVQPMAKQFQKMFTTPAFVATSACDASKEQIVEELSKRLAASRIA